MFGLHPNTFLSPPMSQVMRPLADTFFIVMLANNYSVSFPFCGGGDRGFKSSVSRTLQSPLPPFFLGFLPFALFRLRNIMQCCVISPCFSRFPSFWNSHLPPFPLPPPVPLPPPILPGFRPLSPPLTLLEAATQATFYQALFSFRLVKYSAWKGETKNRASYKSSTAEMFCAHFFH